MPPSSSGKSFAKPAEPTTEAQPKDEVTKGQRPTDAEKKQGIVARRKGARHRLQHREDRRLGCMIWARTEAAGSSEWSTRARSIASPATPG